MIMLLLITFSISKGLNSKNSSNKEINQTATSRELFEKYSITKTLDQKLFVNIASVLAIFSSVSTRYTLIIGSMIVSSVYSKYA